MPAKRITVHSTAVKRSPHGRWVGRAARVTSGARRLLECRTPPPAAWQCSADAGRLRARVRGGESECQLRSCRFLVCHQLYPGVRRRKPLLPVRYRQGVLVQEDPQRRKQLRQRVGRMTGRDTDRHFEVLRLTHIGVESFHYQQAARFQRRDDQPTCEDSNLAAARTASASAPLSPWVFIRRMAALVPGARFGYFFDRLSDYSAAQKSRPDSPRTFHTPKTLVVKEIRLVPGRGFGGGNGVFAGLFARLVILRTVVCRCTWYMGRPRRSPYPDNPSRGVPQTCHDLVSQPTPGAFLCQAIPAGQGVRVAEAVTGRAVARSQAATARQRPPEPNDSPEK